LRKEKEEEILEQWSSGVMETKRPGYWSDGVVE
jgi:hypothetical protein